MTAQVLILLVVAATAVAVQYGLLRIFYERWRLFDIVFFGAFANGWAWGVSVGALGWIRMTRALEAAYTPPYPWYFFVFALTCLSTIFGLASLLPASIVAMVHRRRRALSHETTP